MTTPWIERREIGPVVLYLGDSKALLAAGVFPAGCAVFADPPYGIGYENHGGGANWAKIKEAQRSGAASRIIGDGRPFDPGPWIEYARIGAGFRGNAKIDAPLRIALYGADNYCDRIPPRVGCWLTWDKSCGGGPADSFADSELIWIGTRNARRVYHRQWKGRLRGGDLGPRLHVSQKPVDLCAWVMDTARWPLGCMVLDPYMGSGSIGVACVETGRMYVGCEIDPEHYRTAFARIAAAVGAQ